MSLSTLPSLPVGGKVTQQVLHQMSENVPKNIQTSKGQKKFSVHSSRTSNSGEKKAVKSINKEFIDTARYRYSTKHNFCLDMLQDGFHEAFCELFNLLQKNKELNESVGDNPDEIPALIEEDAEKLEVLKKHLTSAEASRRRGRMDAVYEAQLSLANYFNKTGDSWLADHFFMCCLETSVVLHGDNRRKEAEAHFNLGLAAEKRDNFWKAIELLEKFYDLTLEKTWENSAGQSMFCVACDSLRRVYTRIADEVDNENPEESIQFLIKAYEMAKESRYMDKIAHAGYLLGNAYEKHGDPQTAILYHKSFFDACKSDDDKKGIGDACQALARAYRRLDDNDHAIEYLDLFIEVSEELGDVHAQEAACSEMGSLFDYLGKYQQASQYFNKAYSKAKTLNETSLEDIARLKYGMALGHGMFLEIANKIVINDRGSRDYLLDWKCSRSRDELTTVDEALSGTHLNESTGNSMKSPLNSSPKSESKNAVNAEATEKNDET